MRAMGVGFQSGQIVSIEAALPAIERLAADAKVTAGMGHVAVAVIEVRSGYPNPGYPNRASRLSSTPIQPVGSNRVVSLYKLAYRHSNPSVTNHSERNNYLVQINLTQHFLKVSPVRFFAQR
jgi:hypothetical protein